jgi:hypothetical protein
VKLHIKAALAVLKTRRTVLERLLELNFQRHGEEEKAGA